MRDTDCDLTSVVVVRADGPIAALARSARHARRRRRRGLAAGDADPAARARRGRPRADRDSRSCATTCCVGKHGDHIGGERDAVRALVAGAVDAACVIDGNRARVHARGHVPPATLRVICQTPPYDHCNFTCSTASRRRSRSFVELLLAMSYDDPQVRPLLDLEGLKAWRPGPHERLRAARARGRSVRDARRLARTRAAVTPDRRARRPRARRGRAPADQARARARAEQVEVRGTAPTLGVDLPAWCRARGTRINVASCARRLHRAPRARTAGATPSARAPPIAPTRARRRRAGASRRAARSSRPARPRSICRSPTRDGVGRRGGAPLRPGRRRAVGSRDRDPVGRAGRRIRPRSRTRSSR